MQADRQLQGAANLAQWLIIMAAILLQNGLHDYLGEPPENMGAQQRAKWDLPGPSDHAKSYGLVIRNIANFDLQNQAYSYLNSRRPLHDFITSLKTCQRTEVEIQTWTR